MSACQQLPCSGAQQGDLQVYQVHTTMQLACMRRWLSQGYDQLPLSSPSAPPQIHLYTPGATALCIRLCIGCWGSQGALRLLFPTPQEAISVVEHYSWRRLAPQPRFWAGCGAWQSTARCMPSTG